MLRAQDRTWHLILAACLRIGAADMSAPCPITPDLRQEPGAGKPHAATCAGAGSNPCPYRDQARAALRQPSAKTGAAATQFAHNVDAAARRGCFLVIILSRREARCIPYC